MIFRSFRVGVVWRVLLLTATAAALAFLGMRTGVQFATGLLAVALGAQVYGLIRYVERINRKVQQFFDSVRFADFASGFGADNHLGSSFRALNRSFDEVIEAFRRTRAEKEEQGQYLQTVVQHVSTGLLAFDAQGKIELMNTAARQLLGTPYVRQLDELRAIDSALADTLRQLLPGRHALIALPGALAPRQLAVHATELRQRGQVFRLLSLQDIHPELQAKELEAWQNLIRVLRHEIMNSITPIASLTATVHTVLRDEWREGAVLSAETAADVRAALRTIEQRSAGLLRFVDAYRNFTNLPRPHFRLVAVGELLARIARLVQHELTAQGTTLEVKVWPEDLHVTADAELLEMVLLNLVRNAREAPATRIWLWAGYDAHQRVSIRVTDNGPGIEPEAQAHIFIPFFTTKKGGSGIGLSLSRQIMQQHGGTLQVASAPPTPTVFTLCF